MGSLASVPKISTTPTTSYSVPRYSYSTTSSPNAATTASSTSAGAATSTSTSDSANSAATDTAVTQAARESDLLRRGRGVAGTIRTGFRGLLGLADDVQAKRKTLLGE